MRYPLYYTGSLLLACLIVAGHLAGGVGNYLMVIMGFIGLPFLDAWMGRSRWPSESALARISARTAHAYDLALVLAAAVDVALLLWALSIVAAGGMGWGELIGFTISIGLFSGFIGIVVAHEMMHRNGPGYRLAAFGLMSLVIYPHFCIEHVHGHHPRVATQEDPATARRGESFYRFLPRSALAGTAHAWQLERERLARSGRKVLSTRNRLLVSYGAIGVGLGYLATVIGGGVLGFFLAQSAVAIFLLEGINYLEHYGLVRELRDNGRPVPVEIEHSWNSSHILTNLNLFNLGRHPEHHLQSSRPFYRLRHFQEAPQLPHGYATMFLMALAPPLWFRVMDPRLDAYLGSRAAPDLHENEPVAPATA